MLVLFIQLNRQSQTGLAVFLYLEEKNICEDAMVSFKKEYTAYLIKEEYSVETQCFVHCVYLILSKMYFRTEIIFNFQYVSIFPMPKVNTGQIMVQTQTKKKPCK